MAKEKTGFFNQIKSLFTFKDKQAITIVSGLPRSGTSMMMKMLEAGGIPPVTDQLREADVDNPKGYYEFERVKKMDQGDLSWLQDAPGKAVKVISMLLQHLPTEYTYQIIFMERRLEETLSSQRQMLINRQEDSDASDDELLIQSYQKHLGQIKLWIKAQPNMSVLYVSYNQALSDPTTQIKRIDKFLSHKLDQDQMLTVVDPNLYRQRR